MAFEFPSNPALNQEVNFGTVAYKFDGIGWSMKTQKPTEYVLRQGDIMWGNLEIEKSWPTLQLDRIDDGSAQIHAQKGGIARWNMSLGSQAELGANSGSDFYISRYDDAGNYLGETLVINRATGMASAFGNWAASAKDIITLDYLDARFAAVPPPDLTAYVRIDGASVMTGNLNTPAAVFTAGGSITGGAYTTLTNGGATIHVGADTNTFYRNATHHFQDAAASVTWGTFNAAGLTANTITGSGVWTNYYLCNFTTVNCGNLTASGTVTAAQLTSTWNVNVAATTTTAYLTVTSAAINAVNGMNTYDNTASIRWAWDGRLRAQVNLATALTHVWSDFSGSLVNVHPGYMVLPNYMILQWGGSPSGGDQYITFPTAFPNFCAAVIPVADMYAATNNQQEALSYHAAKISNSSFEIQTRFIAQGGNVGNASQGYKWFAIGW